MKVYIVTARVNDKMSSDCTAVSSLGFTKREDAKDHIDEFKENVEKSGRFSIVKGSEQVGEITVNLDDENESTDVT